MAGDVPREQQAGRGVVVSGPTTVSLVGVGGQGILLAAAVLAQAAIAEGLDVKASEVKGMAQRGGSVLSTVRFGERVASPVCATADVVLAMEVLEGRRSLTRLRADGTLVCALTRIAPASVLRGEATYPDDIESAAAGRRVAVRLVDADGLARAAGNVRAANVVLLGAASSVLPFSDASWQAALAAAIPTKVLDINRLAFDLGRRAGGVQEARQ